MNDTPDEKPTATPKRRVLWINLALVAAFAAVVLGAFVLLRPASPSAEPGGSANPPAMRADSHVLGEPGTGGVTVVEFLDFECEACGAFHPVVEDLRKQYAGEVTFVTRYFPLPGHRNGENAAVAAEAAARQGAYEAMYRKLFETQAEWGERSDSQAPRFREFAAELGLDLAAYDEAVADPAVLDRVRSDVTDGVALGVQSTPTFFVNDRPVAMQAYEDLEAAIERARGD